MPRLRPRRDKDTAPVIELEGAICVETHRPWAIADYIERGTRLPLDHPAVKANPTFFRGLIQLRVPNEIGEEVTDA